MTTPVRYRLNPVWELRQRLSRQSATLDVLNFSARGGFSRINEIFGAQVEIRDALNRSSHERHLDEVTGWTRSA